MCLYGYVFFYIYARQKILAEFLVGYNRIYLEDGGKFWNIYLVIRTNQRSQQCSQV
jgi:hypothetical protein